MHIRCNRFFPLTLLILACLCGFSVSHSQAAPLNYTGPHYVFAHYMVALTPSGPNTTEDQMKQEIIRAQQAGIDGFALNCGSWTVEPRYKQSALTMYQAAKDLGTNFLLFISIDGRLTPTEDEDMMQSTYSQPNQFRYQGKYVISGFGGNVPTQTELNYYTGNGARSVFWIPQFYPTGAFNGQTNQQIADNTLSQTSPADGFFDFLGNPSLQHTWDSTFAAAGKMYMGSIHPFYRGLAPQNYNMEDTRGFAVPMFEWNQAVSDPYPWLELTTWNDYSESTYFDTTPNQWGVNATGYQGPLPSHRGYLDASQYYIQWYKTGQQPPISNDKLFYFYQTHFNNVPAINQPGTTNMGIPNGASSLVNHVYVTLQLTAPAQLTVFSGQTSQNFSVATGIQSVEMPFAAGIQRFLLTRNGATLIDKTGEEQISATDAPDNYDYFSGDSTANQSVSAPYPLATGAPAVRVAYTTVIRTPVDVTIRNHTSGTILYSGTTLSDPASHSNQVVLSDPAVLVNLNDPTVIYDVLIKPQGYLAQKVSATGSMLQGVISAELNHQTYLGDFTGTNRITLGDLVTVIRAFNGEQNLVSTAVGGTPTISDLVTVIRNYNSVPLGEN